MLNSVINEGARGLQLSQQKLQKAAHDIAHFNVSSQVTSTEARPQEAGVLPPVDRSPRKEQVSDIAQPLVELKRQELLFDASAKVVSTANKTLGSLLDIRS